MIKLQEKIVVIQCMFNIILIYCLLIMILKKNHLFPLVIELTNKIHNNKHKISKYGCASL